MLTRTTDAHRPPQPAGDVLLSGLGEAGHLEAYQVT